MINFNKLIKINDFNLDQYLDLKKLITVYFFFIALGSLQRIFSYPFGIGISSILVIFIITIHFKKIVIVIKNNFGLKLIGSLIAYIFIVAVFDSNNRENLEVNVYRLLGLTICYFLCAAASSIAWKLEDLKKIAQGLIIALTIVMILSITDLFFLNIPFLNISYINNPPSNSPVAQFGHRSIMSLYVAVLLIFIFLVSIYTKNLLLRIMVLLNCSCYIYFLIINNNRSAILAILITIFIYNIVNILHKRYKEIIQSLILLSLIFSISIYLAFKLNYTEAHVFLILLTESPYFKSIYLFIIKISNELILVYENPTNIASTLNINTEEKLVNLPRLNEVHRNNLINSDLLRLDLIKVIFNELKYNIFGKGPNPNTHIHFIFDVIYAAGWIGICWLLIFFCYLVKIIRDLLRNYDQIYSVFSILFFTLVVWFIVGIMYNSINMGISWIILGMLLALHQNIKK
jgi:hypothetical protein